MEEEEVKEKQEKKPVIGEFKTSKKLLNFFIALKGNVRIHQKSAFIKGKDLSGTLEKSKFKLTLCDEGTVDFEEVEGNSTDKEMRERLLEEIVEKEVIGYAGKFIISKLTFKDSEDKICYLEVEHEKPYNRLTSILDDIEDDEKPVDIPESSKSKLDNLLGMFDDDIDEEGEHSEVSDNDNIGSNENETVEKDSSSNKSYLEEQFEKMTKTKIEELKTRIEKTNSDIQRAKMDKTSAEKKLDIKLEDLRVLQTRLESLGSKEEPNGYVFFVSEEQKPDIGLSEDNKEIVDKISLLLNLKKDALYTQLTEGFYKIKIAKKSDIENQDFSLDNDILKKIKSLDPVGKLSLTDGSFEYRGDLNWHQLVDKMIKAGFEQSPEFDKICNSNSYDSKYGAKETPETEEDLSESNTTDFTEDQLETIDYYKEDNFDITKKWFLFSIFDMCDDEKAYYSDDDSIKDFSICIQYDKQADCGHGCENFLPDSLKDNILCMCETEYVYNGELSKEEVINELDSSPFFTHQIIR